MTYSIVARDPATGYMGVAVASRFFAVGSLVPALCRNAAVATQGFVNPIWAVEGIARLKDGQSADSILSDFVARDAGEASRQAHMIDPLGQSVAHTGSACINWAGHRIADGISVAGNMLSGPDVVSDTMTCYSDNMSVPFIERLLLAMEAGERAGGDKRGRQAAALRVHFNQDYPRFDLRADDHGDPLAELRRLLAVAQERYIHFAEAMATAENFSGTTDRNELDAAIARAEAERRATGVPSPSHATEGE